MKNFLAAASAAAAVLVAPSLAHADQSAACHALWTTVDHTGAGVLRGGQANALCGTAPRDEPDLALLHALDRPDLANKEIARAYFVRQCFRWPAGDVALRFALCDHDAKLLDKAKYDAEAATLHPDDGDRKLLDDNWQATMVAVDHYHQEWQTHLAARRKDNQRLLVDELERSIQALDKEIATDPIYQASYTLLGRVEAALASQWREHAPRRDVDGCADNAKTLAARIAATKPKTAEQVRQAITTDPRTWLMFELRIACDAAAGRYVDAGAASMITYSRPMFQGPRAQALGALFTAIKDPKQNIDTDIGRAEANLDDLRHTWPLFEALGDVWSGKFDYLGAVEDDPEDANREPSNRRVSLGRIGKLAKTDDPALVKLTFKKETWVTPTWECIRTGKINMFESDGTPVYDSRCHVTGEQTLSMEPSERLIDAVDAAGLKAGQLVKFTTYVTQTNQKYDRATAYVFELDEGKGKGQHAVSYFGYPLAK